MATPNGAGPDAPTAPPQATLTTESNGVEQEFWVGTAALFALLQKWQADRREKAQRERTRAISISVLRCCIPVTTWREQLVASLVPSVAAQGMCRVLPNNAGSCICF